MCIYSVYSCYRVLHSWCKRVYKVYIDHTTCTMAVQSVYWPYSGRTGGTVAVQGVHWPYRVYIGRTVVVQGVHRPYSMNTGCTACTLSVQSVPYSTFFSSNLVPKEHRCTHCTDINFGSNKYSDQINVDHLKWTRSVTWYHMFSNLVSHVQ